MQTSTGPEKNNGTGLRNARMVAALAMIRMEEEGKWSEAALHGLLEDSFLSKRDSAFAAKLLYGTVQNGMLLDWYMRKFSVLRLKKIEPRVRVCMRIGLYEIIMLKVPGHAAVNETVKLVKALCRVNGKVTAFVNAVMRSASKAAEGNALPKLDCPDKESYYSLRYSHPEWLVREFSKEYGTKTAGKICEANNGYAPVPVRVNLLKTTLEEAKKELEDEGINAVPHGKVPEILLCSGGDVTSLRLFRAGEITVQDAASAVAVSALGVKPGMLVLDCCAAPGGKSFLIAEKMKNEGRVISCDIYGKKLEKIKEGAERLGLTIIETELRDASVRVSAFEGKADAVICDVPCSGFGIIRKKPEIRFRKKEDADKLPDIQKKILRNCSGYVKPGGVLVYSTCTILRKENEENVRAFLRGNPEFKLEKWGHPVFGETDGMITLLTPVHGTDGFFISKMRRSGNKG